MFKWDERFWDNFVGKKKVHWYVSNNAFTFQGEVSSSEDGGSSGSEEEFHDGYDENLIGDADDKKRLEQMTEKEREQELFNRIERRQALKMRFAFSDFCGSFYVQH